MDPQRSLLVQDETAGQEGEGQGNSPQPQQESEEQQDSEPMEEGEGQVGGALDETWGDISFGTGEARVGVARGGGEGGEGMEVQMNWNICKYLPEVDDGQCQHAFQVLCVCP